jgi:hypothetical protein
MRKLKSAVVLAIALLLIVATSFAAPQKRSSSSSKPVHVRTYTRKDGTVVQAHDRAAPGTATANSTTGGTGSSIHTPSTPATTTRTLPATTRPVPKTTTPRPSPSPQATARTSAGRIQRSARAKRAFEQSHPCPATGRTTGSCPGYVIDHVTPLACGGTDAPSNMQWQTVAGAKAKDKWERAGCGR